MLYLNFIRYLAGLFLVLGLVTLPNLLQNANGGSRHLALGVVDFVAASTSIANTGSDSWTPCSSQQHCTGHGFCAPVCHEWGHSGARGSHVWMEQCGLGSNAGQSLPQSGLECVNVSTQCLCMPGYDGKDCSLKVPLARPVVDRDGKRIQGWCNVTYSMEDYVTSSLLELVPRIDHNARDAAVCSGHGWCHAQGSPHEPERIDFSFCQCDNGFYGDDCALVVSQGTPALRWPTSDSNDCSTDMKGGVQVAEHVCPATIDTFLIETIVHRCSDHGICVPVSPLPGNGKLPVTGRWRPQTSGLCFCQPGYDGEQCLGGKQLSSTQTSWTGLGSVVIVIGVLVLYRKRRWLEAKFDDDNVTPSDFAVFVQNLPNMSLDTPESTSEATAMLYNLFNKIGPVHFVAPATKDAELIRLFRSRMLALSQLQILHESASYDEIAAQQIANPRDALLTEGTGGGSMRSLTAMPMATDEPVGRARGGTGTSLQLSQTASASRSVASRMASGSTSQGASAAFMPGQPIECPPITGQAELDAARLVEANPDLLETARRWSWVTRLLLEESIAATVFLSRKSLLAYLAMLNQEIKVAKSRPETYLYNRAFVMFSYADHKWKAIKAFSSNRIPVAEGGTKPDKGGSALLDRRDRDPDTPAKGTTGPRLAGTVPGTKFQTALHIRKGSLTLSRKTSWMEGDSAKRRTPSDGGASRGRIPGQLRRSDRNAAESRSSFSDLYLGHQLPQPAELMIGGRIPKVSAAAEPDEVIWESLGSTGMSLFLRGAMSTLLVLGLAFGGWYSVTAINQSRAGGLVGFAIAGAILALNWFGAFVFRRASEYEQHHATGDKTRWIFIKVLVTQVVVTIAAAVIAVYGYPANGQNRYVQDWYAQAGAFVLRTVIVESVVPPILSVMNIPDRIKRLLTGCCFWKSATAQDIADEPPVFYLAERCASLMRTVIMTAALAPGMPSLSFFVAGGLFARSMVDAYCMQHVYRMQQSGPQLIRIMELTLFAAAATNVITARVILNRAAASSMMAEFTFWVFLVLGLWGVSGYATWKHAHEKDCCCGTGPCLPWSRRWACCGSEVLLAPCAFFHELFICSMFGFDFFEKAEDSESALLDETGGVPYHELFAKHGLRRSPYLLFERVLLFRESLFADEDDLYVQTPMTGSQFLDFQEQLKLARSGRRRAVAAGARPGQAQSATRSQRGTGASLPPMPEVPKSATPGARQNEAKEVARPAPRRPPPLHPTSRPQRRSRNSIAFRRNQQAAALSGIATMARQPLK